MYEYEFRKIRRYPSFAQASRYLEGLVMDPPEIIYFLKSFRFKNGTCEIKKKLRQVAVFFDGEWFEFVESKEIPYGKWDAANHREFFHLAGLDRQNVLIETRYNVRLVPSNTKLYAFSRSDDVFGVAFELETTLRTKQKVLRPPLHLLRPYAPYYGRFPDDGNEKFPFLRCRRRPVLHTIRPPSTPNFLKAVKHDGIHGFVYCYPEYLWERWEDNRSRVVRHANPYGGTVFSAERMRGSVVLLDVLQVRGCKVYRGDVRHVLLHFLPTVRLPYRIQKYYLPHEPVPKDLPDQDGIIYHTFDDKIWKHKPFATVDLFYENGAFVTDEREYPYTEKKKLRDGTVYECRTLPIRVIRKRRDRFLGNTANQISRIVHGSSQKLFEETP